MSNGRTILLSKDDLCEAVSLWVAKRYPELSGKMELSFEADPWEKDITCKAVVVPREAKP